MSPTNKTIDSTRKTSDEHDNSTVEYKEVQMPMNTGTVSLIGGTGISLDGQSLILPEDGGSCGDDVSSLNTSLYNGAMAAENGVSPGPGGGTGSSFIDAERHRAAMESSPYKIVGTVPNGGNHHLDLNGRGTTSTKQHRSPTSTASRGSNNNSSANTRKRFVPNWIAAAPCWLKFSIALSMALLTGAIVLVAVALGATFSNGGTVSTSLQDNNNNNGNNNNNNASDGTNDGGTGSNNGNGGSGGAVLPGLPPPTQPTTLPPLLGDEDANTVGSDDTSFAPPTEPNIVVVSPTVAPLPVVATTTAPTLHPVAVELTPEQTRPPKHNNHEATSSTVATTPNPTTPRPTQEHIPGTQPPTTREPTHAPSTPPSVTSTATIIPTDPPTFAPFDEDVTVFYVTGGRFTNQALQALPQQLPTLPVRGMSAFLVHLGDWNSPYATQCNRQSYQDINSLFSFSSVPTYFLPGDNDFNDCHIPEEALSLWHEHLLEYETQHWPDPFYWNVTRQDPNYPENFAFVYNEVLFVGINLVGGVVHDEQEWESRQLADLEWIDGNYREYRREIEVMVVFAHADPDVDSNTRFYEPFKQLCRNEYDRIEVILIHRNLGVESWSYTRRFENIDNLSVVVVEGSVWPPLRAQIDLNNNRPFSFDQDDWYSDYVRLQRQRGTP